MSIDNFEILYQEFNEKIGNAEFEDSLLLIPELLKTAHNDIDIFYTLMGEATVLTNLKKDDEVIDSYDEIINRFEKSEDETISKFLAYAFYNKALIYAKKREYKNELKVYNSLIEKYIDDLSPELEVVLVKAYLNKAICINELFTEASKTIEIYKEFISNFENSEYIQTKESIVFAYYSIASIYTKENEIEKSIEVYDELIEKFSNIDDENIQEYIAKSMINKASRVQDLNKNRLALEIYDEIVERFDGSKGKILKQVALALHNKSVILGQLHEEKKLMEVCDTILEKFSNINDEMIVNIVSSAQVIKDKERFNSSF